jgi:hypothetical protein
MTLPTSTIETGWPLYLRDTGKERYVRIRDGVTHRPGVGEACLYGRLHPTNFIHRNAQYVPTLGSVPGQVTMAGGTWMKPEEFVEMDLAPITIPQEPVEWQEPSNGQEEASPEQRPT